MVSTCLSHWNIVLEKQMSIHNTETDSSMFEVFMSSSFPSSITSTGSSSIIKTGIPGASQLVTTTSSTSSISTPSTSSINTPSVGNSISTPSTSSASINTPSVGNSISSTSSASINTPSVGNSISSTSSTSMITDTLINYANLLMHTIEFGKLISVTDKTIVLDIDDTLIRSEVIQWSTSTCLPSCSACDCIPTCSGACDCLSSCGACGCLPTCRKDGDSKCRMAKSYHEKKKAKSYHEIKNSQSDIIHNKTQLDAKQGTDEKTVRHKVITINGEYYHIKYHTRPYLKRYLILCGYYFQKIIIWSAGCKEYVNAIVEDIFDGIRRPDYVFNFNDCEKIGEIDKNISYHKPLSKIIPYLRRHYVSISPRSGIISCKPLCSRTTFKYSVKPRRDNVKCGRETLIDFLGIGTSDIIIDDMEVDPARLALPDSARLASPDSASCHVNEVKGLLQHDSIIVGLLSGKIDDLILSKLLIVDDLSCNFIDNPNNGILIPKFIDSDKDYCLLQLICWFGLKSVMNSDDVRILEKDNIFIV